MAEIAVDVIDFGGLFVFGRDRVGVTEQKRIQKQNDACENVFGYGNGILFLCVAVKQTEEQLKLVLKQAHILIALASELPTGKPKKLFGHCRIQKVIGEVSRIDPRLFVIGGERVAMVVGIGGNDEGARLDDVLLSAQGMGTGSLNKKIELEKIVPMNGYILVDRHLNAAVGV
jgi:hypothetical protein